MVDKIPFSVYLLCPGFSQIWLIHAVSFSFSNAKSTKSVASVGYTVATVKYPLAWVSAKKR